MGMLVYFLTFSVIFLETLNFPTSGIFLEKSAAPIFTNKVSYERQFNLENFLASFFHLSVSSLFCVSLYISPKKFPKKWNFSKSKHFIDKNERIYVFCLLTIPQSIRPIAVSYLAKKIKTFKNLGNFQQIKKHIRNIQILFKAMEKVHQSLVFLVLAVKHSIATSFWCCCYFSERVKYPTKLP